MLYEHSSEHDSLSSHEAFISVSEVRLIIHIQIVFTSGNCCKTHEMAVGQRNKSLVEYLPAVWEEFSEEVTFKQRP